MKVLLAFLVGAAVNALAQLPPAILTAPHQPAVPPEQGQAQPQTGTPFRAVLQPAYSAIVGSGDINEITPVKMAGLRNLFTALPPSQERDAALRFIGVAERAAAVTAPFQKRYNQQAPRLVAETSATDATNRESFFRRGTVTEWRAQMRTFVAAASAEWLGIPETAASPALTAFVTARKREIASASAEPLTIQVSQVIGGGVLANPYEDYAIASGTARFGGGGGVASGSRPGSKTIYLTGSLFGVTDGQSLRVTAYRDGTHRYTSVSGAVRTVEKWVLVKVLPENAR